MVYWLWKSPTKLTIRRVGNCCPHTSYKEIGDLQEELRGRETYSVSSLEKSGTKENFFFKPLLEELGNDHLPFSILMQIIWGRLIL
ncbi:hypothetical protein OROHE_010108 [Orobanche hederae]